MMQPYFAADLNGPELEDETERYVYLDRWLGARLPLGIFPGLTARFRPDGKYEIWAFDGQDDPTPSDLVLTEPGPHTLDNPTLDQVMRLLDFSARSHCGSTTDQRNFLYPLVRMDLENALTRVNEDEEFLLRLYQETGDTQEC